MNAQLTTQTNEERLSIWIPLPYFYFTQPHIKMLCKKEQSLNRERLKKWKEENEKNPKTANPYRESKLFYVYQQMLCLSIPTHGKLRYNDRVGYNAGLLASVLDGDFWEEEITEILKIFEEELYLISIDVDKTIVMNYFDDSFPGQSKADEVISESKGKKGRSDLEGLTTYTQKLIEWEYIKANHKQLDKFEEFFKKVIPTLTDFTEGEIKDIIYKFIHDDVPTLKEPIKSHLSVFEKSFRKSIEDVRKKRSEAEFQRRLSDQNPGW